MIENGPGFLAWLTVLGALLLIMGLASAHLRSLPISSSVIYLLLGLTVGPSGFGWLRVDLSEATLWLERVTEIAVIISLFVGGLKLRLPIRNPVWRPALLLAGPVMFASIAGVAAFAVYVFGLTLSSALLLGAVLAPTDPVLASAVTVSDAADEDRVRYGLSGEAGLNDGMAFPFVVLALDWARHGSAGAWIGTWAAHRLLWAVPAGLLFGYAIGKGIGRLSIWLRARHRDHAAPSDLLALALIALSYSGAEAIGAWGFLSVFAAGFGLRRAELQVVRESPHPDIAGAGAAPDQPDPPHPPAEHLVPAKVESPSLDQPAIAAGVLVSETLRFGDTSERLIEVGLVMLVGAAAMSHWDVRALPLALFLFVILRPLSTRALLARTQSSNAQRWLMGWFGLRGIGSLYYLTYALNHGAAGPLGEEISNLTLSTVLLSILFHGISAQPLLSRYERALGAA